MLINLVPEFFAALEAADPLEGYRRYIAAHEPVLSAYWHNYILDLDSPHAEEVMRRTVDADRRDLKMVLDEFDFMGTVEETMKRCQDIFEIDCDFDVYLMVGVGGANAAELVVGDRGIAFACLEHFTGRANPETLGLGLKPDLVPLWIAHEIAHTVRYGSPDSNSEIKPIVESMNGYYDYWETGSRATLQELLVNEGLAVAASKRAVPGFDAWEYLGYARRQYRRMRELDSFLIQHLKAELGSTGLGYRLRYLSGGMSAAQRLVAGKVIPERSGYYVGLRMVEAIIAQQGIARALRASGNECHAAELKAADQTA